MNENKPNIQSEVHTFPKGTVSTGKRNKKIILIGGVSVLLLLIVFSSMILVRRSPAPAGLLPLAEEEEGEELVTKLSGDELQDLVINSIKSVQENGALVGSAYVGKIESIRRFDGRDYQLISLHPETFEGDERKLAALIQYFGGQDLDANVYIDLRFDDILTTYIGVDQNALKQGDKVRIQFGQQAFINGFLTAEVVELASSL